MATRDGSGGPGVAGDAGPHDAGGNPRPPAPARFLKEWREFAELQDGALASQAAHAAAIVRQAGELLRFAAQRGWFLGPELEALLPLDAGTEHDIFRHAVSGRAWKVTHPGRWRAKQEPPTEYLKNLQRLTVLAPPLDIRIEGVLAENEEPQLAISMEWINGEHPTAERFAQELAARQWVRLGDTTYQHAPSRLVIRDAHKDNFILTPSGRLLPIDLAVDPLPQGVLPRFMDARPGAV